MIENETIQPDEPDHHDQPERKPRIKIESLSKSFGGRPILRDVNLEIYPGEIVYVIGKSGAGKSVLLKHLIGLLAPDSGHILFDGVDIYSQSPEEVAEFRKTTGVLFQMAALFDSLSVFDNVAFALKRFTKLPDEEIQRLTLEKLALVGLSGVENYNPASLSIGMQKRVGLARAIAMSPQIVFCDEPTTGVDPLIGAAVDDLIVKLNRELGVTVMVISHDMESVFRTAHRVAMLFEGRPHFVGTPQELKESDDPVIRQFVEGRAEGPIPIL